MRCRLLYAGTAVGTVALEPSDVPAAGWLDPLPAYEGVAHHFRRAGDALWLNRFRADDPEVARWVAAAEALKPELSLADERGEALPVARLDFWDSALDGDPPLVMAYFDRGAAGAGVLARPRRPPAAGGEGSRPAT